MARVIKNPFGELSGKVGTVVFKKGKNGAYISSLPTSTRHKPSVLQERQRLKMTTVMDFLKPLQQLFKEAYFPFEANKSGFHAAKSYYLREVVLPVGDTFEIDYPKALVSFGDLRPAVDVQLISDTNQHQLRLQWTDNSAQAMAYADDCLIVVIYTPQSNKMMYRTDLALRANGEATIDFNVLQESTNVHVWIGFYRPNKQRASMSTYAGSIVV